MNHNRLRSMSAKLRANSMHVMKPMVSSKFESNLGSSKTSRTELEQVLIWARDSRPELYKDYVRADSEFYHAMERIKGDNVNKALASMREAGKKLLEAYRVAKPAVNAA